MSKLSFTKSSKFINILSSQMSNPVVILDRNDEIEWANQAFKNLVPHIGKKWEQILTENFSHTLKEAIFPRMLQSQTKPSLVFDISSKIFEDKRIIEFNLVSKYKSNFKRLEEQVSQESIDIGQTFEEVLETLNHEILKRGIVFRVIPGNCYSIVNEKIIQKAIGHFLCASLKIFENTSLTVYIEQMYENKLKMKITNKFYTEDDLLKFKKNIREKAILHLQHLEETIEDFSPHIKIFEETADGSEPSFNIEVQFNPEMTESKNEFSIKNMEV